MGQIPAMPKFGKVSIDTKSADWADAAKATKLIKQIDALVNTNSLSHQHYFQESLVQSKLRVKLMQLGLEAVTKGKPSPAGVATDAEVKKVRDEVKKLKEDGETVTKAYYAAMGDFRVVSDFGLPKPYNDAVKVIRSKAQDRDKTVSSTLAELKALEGFASGIIKNIRERRDVYQDDVARLKKIDSAQSKLKVLANSASTNLVRMESALKSIKALVPKLPQPQFEKDIRGKALDVVKHHTEYRASRKALVQMQAAIETLGKGIGRKDIQSIADGKGKDVKQAIADLENQKKPVDKLLEALRKDKAMPKDLVAALPEKLP